MYEVKVSRRNKMDKITSTCQNNLPQVGERQSLVENEINFSHINNSFQF